MSGRPEPHAAGPPGRCAQCGFPSAATFCCFGCALLNQIAGARGERGAPSFILARLGLAAFLSMNVMCLSLVLYAGDPLEGGAASVDPFASGMASLFRFVLMLLSLPVMVLLGWPILESGVRRLRGRGAGVDSLIALGAVAAFGLSLQATWSGRGAVYYETACMTLVLLTLGRYLEARARSRAADSLGSLLERETEIAIVLRQGVGVEAPAATLRPGDIVRIAPGARLPVDGIVLEGEGGVDESALSGEALPVFKTRGSRVLAGTISVDGAFLVRATATGIDRTAARVARLLEEARASRAPIELLSDRVARVFVPLACAAALATGLYWGLTVDAGTGVACGLSVLLIACPCALGLATPLAIWEAIGTAARRGTILKAGDTIERLWSLRSIFFDKTGTLTRRAPRVACVRPAPPWTEDDVLALAATLEEVSEHPLARSVVLEARRRGLSMGMAVRFRVHPGLGVEGDVAVGDDAPRRVSVGAPGAFVSGGARPDPAAAEQASSPAIEVRVDGAIAGVVEFEEDLRPEAAEALAGLRHRGLGLGILTGDRATATARLAGRIGVGAVSGLDPGGKVSRIAESEGRSGPAGMVGEGVNDAPAMARASVSFALGCGDDLAQEAADVRLLRDDLAEIPWLIDLARRTRRVIRGNLFWALAYNVVLIPVAMTGHLQPVLAALAMIASSLFVVGRSRSLRREAKGSPGARRNDDEVAVHRVATAEGG